MDKKTEQKKSHKDYGDTDEGVHEYGKGNKRWQGDGLWAVPPKEIVGLSPSRIVTNDYCKEKGEGKKKEGASGLIESLLENGLPMLNKSKTRRVF